MREAAGVLIALLGVAAVSQGAQTVISGKDILERGSVAGVMLSPEGSARLESRSLSGAAGLTLDLPEGRKSVTLRTLEVETPGGARMWPVLASDVITQVRFRLRDGKWTAWAPRNLLRGGDMADSDGDGIPDWTSVMRLRESKNLMYADTCVPDRPPPSGDYWVGKDRYRGRFTDPVEAPPGAEQSLRLTRATSDGQDTAAMRLDLVPPDTDLTVCGWTKYDLGGETSMGVMARFHEFDGEGNRINK
jgi:hypothetical protein